MSINLISPINSLGYGYTGFHITEELIRQNINVSLFPISEIEPSLRTPAILNAVANAEFFNFSAPCVRIWHQFDMAQFVGRGPHIGFPIFELDTFTDREKHHLKSCDYLFVCSEWAKETCVINGLDRNRIVVIPLGVDTSIFNTSESRNPKTVFFNIGKWEKRKGHDVLIKAFKKAFGNSSDVILLMCCSNPFLTGSEEAKWCSLYNSPNIRIIPRLPSQVEVAALIKSADCGVFPSRAEGWNLEALETLSCGKHLIITDATAHTEFCNSQNAKLISAPEVELAFDGKWFNGQGNWHKVENEQVDQMADYMLAIHKLKQSSQLGINEEGRQTAEQYTWTNTVNKIWGHINALQNTYTYGHFNP